MKNEMRSKITYLFWLSTWTKNKHSMTKKDKLLMKNEMRSKINHFSSFLTI